MEARVMTPFTYFSLPMQKQFLANQQAIQGKPYADFFRSKISVPLSAVEKIQQGPMPLAAWDHFKASIALLSSRHSPSLNTTFTLNGSALSKESPR